GPVEEPQARRPEVPLIRGRRSGAIVALALAAAAGACSSRSTTPTEGHHASHATAQPPGTVRTRIPVTPYVERYFLHSVVHDQFGGARHVVRWSAPGVVRVAVQGSPTADDLAILGASLRAYDGTVPFTLRRAARGQITVHFAPKSQWARILHDRKVD